MGLASPSLRSVLEGVTGEERFAVALAKIGCDEEQIGQFKLEYVNDLAFGVIVEKFEHLARTPTTGDPVSRVRNYLKKCEDTLEEERALVRRAREDKGFTSVYEAIHRSLRDGESCGHDDCSICGVRS